MVGAGADELAAVLRSRAACCGSITELKQIHSRLLRCLDALLPLHANFILAKLLRFASVSPAGDLNHANLLFSYHFLAPLSSNANGDRVSKTAFFFNTLIRGYANSSHPSRAISLFKSMLSRSVPVDPFSFTFLLKARSRSDSSTTNLLGRTAGGEIHATALKFGCLGPYPSHTHVHNALMNLYAAGDATAARKVFDEMPARDVVSWSSLLNVHLIENDTDGARELFDRMPDKDVVSWTAMISSYSRAHRPREALELFFRMEEPPDEVTMVGVISACTELGDIEAGENTHRYIQAAGFGWMVSIQNALIDMYSKCGWLSKAKKVFEDMYKRTLVSWNSMIAACASHGCAEDALSLFKQMIDEGVKPDGVTFLIAMTACAHDGMVEEGRQLLKMMGELGVSAGVEHYGCLVDMLGRAGKVEEACFTIQGMPVPSNDKVWGALLGACRNHGEAAVGQCAAAGLMGVNPVEGGYYVLLSNIHAAAGRHEDAIEMRRFMRKMKAFKSPGCSSYTS